MPDQTNERDSADRAGRDARLDRLDAALERARGKSEPQARPTRASSMRGLGQALRLSSEFIAGILVGGGLGWLVDRVFAISPWGLIVFLLLGFAAGVLNVLRAVKLIDEAAARMGGEPPQE